MRAEGGAERNSDEGEWTTVRLKKTRQRDKGVAMASFTSQIFQSLGAWNHCGRCSQDGGM